MDCPHCFFRNPSGHRFCGQCGALLGVQQTAEAAREDEAERRHLTVMFCDLVGSVALSTTLDPEEFRELLSRYLEAASVVVRRFSGFVGQYHGDGMLVYFGYPKAREDSAVLGVRAGLGILRAIEEVNRESSTQLRVRIGLHTGLLIVGDFGSGERRESSVVIGKTPNLASRLQSLAQPGTVVISGDTWKLVRRHFHCGSLGEHAVKGLCEPLEIYQVLGDADVDQARSAARDLTRLYGRDLELARLRNQWAEAAAGGAPRLALTGEAGIGKSRLVREFSHSLAGQAHFCLLARGFASAQNSAFQPLLQLLRERIEISRTDTPEEQLERIAGFAQSLQFPPETFALLAAVLCPGEPSFPDDPGLSPAAVRQRLIAWLPELLRALAARKPVLFVVEDLHWMDPSTLEALAHLFGIAPLPRVLLLLTARPEFSAPWLPEVLALERLPAPAVAEFAEAVGGGKELPAEVVRQIVTKANGIPLFIEEMTKMVLETGLLVERETHFETRAPLPPMAIPDTLHELLMARLDGSATVREVAQIAAVLGTEFRYEMLRALCPFDDAVLHEQLARLVEAGLLAQSGTIPDATFAFRHALIQAEAYQSLLKRKRQHYHERIADLLTERFPETLRTHPELVAQHYTEAGRHPEAIGLWLQAATRSVERSANAEAVAQAERGLALLGALPDEENRRERELTLTITRGRAEAMLRGYAAPEVQRDYSRARELCRATEASPEIYQVLGALHAFYTARAEFKLAHEMAEQMLRLGEATGSTVFLDNAFLSLAANEFYLGKFEDALRFARRALDVYETHTTPLPPRTLDIKVAALAWGGLALMLCGQPDEGLAWAQKAHAFALELAHPHSVVFARHLLQLAHYWRDEPVGVLAESEALAALSREQGFVYWLTAGITIEGWARVRLGQHPAIELVEKGLAGWQRTGTRLAAAQQFGFLAAACAEVGRAAEGLTAIASAEEIAQASGERCYGPHLAELKGLLLLRKSPPDRVAAKAAFRAAIKLAREISAAWLELRAAVHLARLLREDSRGQEARALLDPCLRSIMGGEDTALVRQARQFLTAEAPSELHAD